MSFKSSLANNDYFSKGNAEMILNESDMPSRNTMNKEKFYVRRHVYSKPYQFSQPVQNEMKVICEFPQTSENDEGIKREIKRILTDALQEQLAMGRRPKSNFKQ